MPNTVIFTANQKGRLKPVYDIANDAEGAPFIWNTLCKIHIGRGINPKRVDEDLRMVFDLIYNPGYPYSYRLVLASALDGAVVYKDNMGTYNRALSAFVSQYPTDNLKSQLQFLELRARDKDCMAVAWSQTSMNLDAWTVVKRGIRQKYNLLKDKGHFDVFKLVTLEGQRHQPELPQEA